MSRLVFAAAALLGLLPASALADNLYGGSNWSSMSSDRRATNVGDLLTVVIFQAAESSTAAQSSSRKTTDLSGSISGGSLSEGGKLSLGGGYTGRAEVRRSDKLITQITLSVLQVLPNGDLIIGGQQWLKVNGERTQIGVRGRVRSADIRPDNSVPSNRIADAQIDYDGRGFVSRSARPGLLNRIFSFLGLG